MSALDLSAVVDAAARAEYERKRQQNIDAWLRAGHEPMDQYEYDELSDFQRHVLRESVLGTVTATLRALEPMATHWALEAWKHANLGDLAGERGDWTLKHIEHGRRDALSDVVNNLRALVPTPGEKQ